MEQSEKLDKLAPALATAQDLMTGAKKDSNNPFFKSKYADLTSVWIACKDALHVNGLSVIQSPISGDGRIGVTTMLLHSSGQYVKDSYTLGVKKQNDPQADGSSITYARRYALAAFVGICPVDDDGEKAMARNAKKESPKVDPSEKAFFTFQARIDSCKSADEIDEWCNANWNKVETALNKEDLTKARSYLTQSKDKFS